MNFRSYKSSWSFRNDLWWMGSESAPNSLKLINDFATNCSDHSKNRIHFLYKKLRWFLGPSMYDILLMRIQKHLSQNMTLGVRSFARHLQILKKTKFLL